MVTLFLFLVLVWVVAGVIGFVVHGLFWLFVLACILFAATLVAGGYRRGRIASRPRR